MYFEMKTWSRTRGVDGRLPLFTAAARSLKWSYTRQIFTANMPVVDEIDVLTGLPLFMLAALGPSSDIESVYNLLRESPPAIGTMNITKQNYSLNSSRKRGQVEFDLESDAKVLKVGD